MRRNSHSIAPSFVENIGRFGKLKIIGLDQAFLNNSLDKGEAAVIQLALDQCIKTVCIDESIGRRIARLNNLSLTGSIGILARYKQELDADFSLLKAVDRMQKKGIRLGDNIIQFATMKDNLNG